jgi:ribosomal protein S18 acetylase RimI-like enzyme
MNSNELSGAADRADAAIVQHFLRTRARNGVQVGPFSILLSPGDRSPYANYAIPADGAEPTRAQIAELEEAFRSRHRQPRLEYVPAAAPAAEPALIAAGFTVELRPPLMTRRADAQAPQPPLEGFDLAFVEAPEALNEAVRVQAEAFGGEELDAQWMMGVTRRGGRVMLAHDRPTGEAAGAGAFIPPLGGVTEVVGIGVAPRFRRRGLAQAITARLAEAAFEAGCGLTFLSAAGEAQSEIYARAGFQRRSPMLFISKPEG